MIDGLHSAERRKILGDGLRLATAVTITSFVPAVAMAADQPAKVSPDDTLAKSLQYVEDAGEAKSSAHKQGQHCALCNFYSGKDGAENGPCQIFQGKLVHSKGWCKSFTAKSG